MATIDIGKLTFTHKGDYAGGTAYVANDVVYYNGSAYVAKTSTTGNLPTSTAHWNTFAAGSGGIWNAGLSLGSAGQAVKVNAAGNALEFGTAGGLVSTGFNESTTSHTISASSFTMINGSNFTVAMTAGQKLHLFAKVYGYQDSNDQTETIGMFVTESGGSALNIKTTATGSGGMGNTNTGYKRYWHAGAYDHGLMSLDGWWVWTAQTTGTHTFDIRMHGNGSGSINTAGTFVWYKITSV